MTAPHRIDVHHHILPAEYVGFDADVRRLLERDNTPRLLPLLAARVG